VKLDQLSNTKERELSTMALPNYWVDHGDLDGTWDVCNISDESVAGTFMSYIDARQFCADLNLCGDRPWARMLLRNHSTI
jgi:hypothetical protein